ncbi:hypothetical protein BGX34_000569 [Mortierella sp. NVP85]|nr:hypothetical protein BGX34_000569 [Mortierella sp. NVP85]
MSHQRSKSTSSSESPTAVTPLSISIPRQRSMSTSLGLATSPIAMSGSSILSSSHNPLFSSAVSPTTQVTAPPVAGFGTTPPTTLSSLSGSVPTSIHRRFSASFTNPLNNHTPVVTGSSAAASVVGAQVDERGRRSSLFGTSPPVKRHTINTDRPPDHTVNTAGGGGGGGGGIGGLFRKFSVGSRSGVTSQHPLDSNEAGPPAVHPIGQTPLSNTDEHKNRQNHFDARSPLGTLKSPQQQDKNSRSNSPMRSMILNGQMLD